jgi:putative MATE family efflux protein
MEEVVQRKKGHSMIEGSPLKPLIFFTIPMILGNLFQQFYNIVDSIIVGNVKGPDALAAVGASTATTMLFVMVALGTGIGCSVVISQLYGAKQLEKMKTAISTTLIFVSIFSIILSLIGLLFNTSIMRLMGTPENIFKDAAAYLAIYFYGFIFLFLYNAISTIFNALGDSTKPLVFLFISSLLNVGLDLLFVIKFDWGVPGVAWATLISQGVSAVISSLTLLWKLKHMPTAPFAKFDGKILKKMITIAVPTIIQQSIVSVGMILIQSAVNRFGSTFLAGYTAAVKIDGIAIVPMVAVGNAMSTYVSQNIGARKPERIKNGFHICLAMVISIGLLIALIQFFFCERLVRLFMDASAGEAISVGSHYLRVVSIFYFVMGIMNVTNSILRGSADMRWFLSCSVVNLLTRVVLTYAMADATGGMIIMWANPAGWFAGLLVALFRYIQGGWKSKQLV